METTEAAIKRHERWLQEQEATSRHRVWLEEQEAAISRHRVWLEEARGHNEALRSESRPNGEAL